MVSTVRFDTYDSWENEVGTRDSMTMMFHLESVFTDHM